MPDSDRTNLAARKAFRPWIFSMKPEHTIRLMAGFARRRAANACVVWCLKVWATENSRRGEIHLPVSTILDHPFIDYNPAMHKISFVDT